MKFTYLKYIVYFNNLHRLYYLYTNEDIRKVLKKPMFKIFQILHPLMYFNYQEDSKENIDIQNSYIRIAEQIKEISFTVNEVHYLLHYKITIDNLYKQTLEILQNEFNIQHT